MSARRLVRFADAQGTACWGRLVAGVSTPKLGDDLELVPNPLTQELPIASQPGEMRSIHKLLPALPINPVPSILCVGLNFKKHADECNLPEPEYPVIFTKFPTSVCATGEPIVVPKCAQDPVEVDYEVELGIVIGETCKNCSVEEAPEKILGYVVANDVSARLWQTLRGGGQWGRAKSFDSFCPVGSTMGLAEDFDGNSLSVSTTVNGITLQDSHTSDFIFNVGEVVSFLSTGTTLQAGTLILTGTPWGVGMGRGGSTYLKEGDEVTVSVQEIGSVTNTVVYEK
jgi:2-keto-4-pentenoate hydratase/2-oxohepta-3-ene-1,7-dioic acid hydratase in catechol pathway